jgi:hypothetical protein
MRLHLGRLTGSAMTAEQLAEWPPFLVGLGRGTRAYGLSIGFLFIGIVRCPKDKAVAR